MKVNEIFHSIQGEGTFMGTPCTFIRLAGCNLNCEWCDTEWDSFTEMTIPEIVQLVKFNFVVITGGEPFIHDELLFLTTELKNLYGKGLKIAIETNGTFSTEKFLNSVDWISCSPKPQRNWSIHPECIYNELKYVVDNAFDLTKIHINFQIQEGCAIWLQPEGYNMEKSFKKAFKLAMESKCRRIRVGIQLHKIMEVK